MVLPLDGSARDWASSGVNADGIIDYPVTVIGVTILQSTVFRQVTGRVFIDDVSAHYGAVVRGAILAGETTQVRAISTYTPGVFSVPAPSSIAWRLSPTGAQVTVPVSQYRATIDIGIRPDFLYSTLSASPATVAPGGYATLSWLNGEDTVVSLVINDASGAQVTVLRSQSLYAVGLAKVVWNTRDSRGAIVGTGDYTARFTLISQTGVASILSIPILVK